MRIKTFLISIILIFQAFFASFLFLNNNDNNYNNKNINISNLNNIKFQFSGFSDSSFSVDFKIVAPKIENYYLDSIEINCEESYDSEGINFENYQPFVDVNLNQKTSVDIDNTLSLSTISIDEDNRFLFLNNELNKNTFFENANYQYYYSLKCNFCYSFEAFFHYVNINDQNQNQDIRVISEWYGDSWSINNPKFEPNKFNNFKYISDWNDDNFDWFYASTDISWSSKILEDSINIYKESYPGNGQYSIKLNKNDYKIEYNEKTCQYSIYIKPYSIKNGDLNSFKISYNNEYIYNDYYDYLNIIDDQQTNKNISSILDFTISDRNSKPEIKTKVTPIKKINKYEIFSFNYSIIINNDLNSVKSKINTIYIANSTNIEFPIDGFGPNKFVIYDDGFSDILGDEFDFSIQEKNIKQKFDNFVLVLKLNTGDQDYIFTKNIDPFFVYSNNLLIWIFILVIISITIFLFCFFIYLFKLKKNNKFKKHKTKKGEIYFDWI